MEKILRDRRIYDWMEKVDIDSLRRLQEEACLFCVKGKLHRADYKRLPRGAPAEVLKGWEKRFSLCCDQEGCRKRHTPPSVRFLGRKVYIGVVVVLVSAMMYGANPRRLAKLREAMGIDVRTLEHWRRYWMAVFVEEPFWRAQRARFMPALEEETMPYCLVEAFGAQRLEGLIRLMKFLSPITTSWKGVVAI